MADTKAPNGMNEEQLERTAGGNYGDSGAEFKNKEALYKVGDVVEIFIDSFHIFTHRVKIIKVEIDDAFNGIKDVYASYTAVGLDGSDKGTIHVFDADSVER